MLTLHVIDCFSWRVFFPGWVPPAPQAGRQVPDKAWSCWKCFVFWFNGRHPLVPPYQPVRKGRRITMDTHWIGTHMGKNSSIAAPKYIWRFPEIGVPPDHPFSMGFSIANHPAIGVPSWLWKPPHVMKCHKFQFFFRSKHGRRQAPRIAPGRQALASWDPWDPWDPWDLPGLVRGCVGANSLVITRACRRTVDWLWEVRQR